MTTKKIILFSIGIVVFIFGFYNGYHDTLAKNSDTQTLTPQEQIVSRIATTSFPDRIEEVSPTNASGPIAIASPIFACA